MIHQVWKNPAKRILMTKTQIQIQTILRLKSMERIKMIAKRIKTQNQKSEENLVMKIHLILKTLVKQAIQKIRNLKTKIKNKRPLIPRTLFQKINRIQTPTKPNPRIVKTKS